MAFINLRKKFSNNKHSIKKFLKKILTIKIATAASNIPYNCIGSDKERSIFISEIKNEEQLKVIFPFYISLGAINELIVWSSNKNVFSLDKREWSGKWAGDIRETVIVKMEANTSIFWIAYDGDSIATVSNQLQFSTYQKITQTFPKFVSPKLCEYGEV